MRSATEGCDETRQHRVTGHSPNPGAAAGRKGFRPRRVTLVELSTIESENDGSKLLKERSSFARFSPPLLFFHRLRSVPKSGELAVKGVRRAHTDQEASSASMEVTFTWPGNGNCSGMPG